MTTTFCRHVGLLKNTTQPVISAGKDVDFQLNGENMELPQTAKDPLIEGVIKAQEA